MVKSLEELMGKVVLVGLTFYDKDDKQLRREQYYGTVVSVDKVVTICGVDKEHTLPPDKSSFAAAKPGLYTLHSTGEQVENPDYISTWNIHEPD